MITFNIKMKNEQAIKICQKYFHCYDTFYNNKQKVTKNKFAPEIFSFV